MQFILTTQSTGNGKWKYHLFYGDDWGMVYDCFTNIIQYYPLMGNSQYYYPVVIIQ